jgi:hypothetical protein
MLSAAAVGCQHRSVCMQPPTDPSRGSSKHSALVTPLKGSDYQPGVHAGVVKRRAPG